MTAKIVLGATTNAQGLSPVRVDIVCGRTRTTISTGICVDKKDYLGEYDRKTGDFVCVKKSSTRAASINREVVAYLDRVNAAKAALIAVGQLEMMTAVEFRNYVLNRNVKVVAGETEAYFAEVFKEYTDRLDHWKTREAYNYTYDKMCRFVNVSKLRFCEMNVAWMHRFNGFLKKDGLSENTCGIVMRNIRTIFNYAIACDYTKSKYPFGRHLFSIKKGAPAKSILPLSVIREIAMYPCVPGSMREQARDAFMFSLYAGGINPIDMYKNLQFGDGDLIYVREKIRSQNGNPVHLKMTPSMKRIADKYKAKKNDYMVFNFSERIRTYHSWYCKVRQELHRLGEDIGYPELHYYLARYAFSTYAASRACGVDLRTIEMTLGHVPTDVTSNYYIIYDWLNTFEAQDKLEEFINSRIYVGKWVNLEAVGQ